MISALDLYHQRFAIPRDPRSAAYKAGVLAALRFRLERARICPPYEPGSAERDAFQAGCDEGHKVASSVLERAEASRVTLHCIARTMRDFSAAGAPALPSLLQTWAAELAAVEQSLRGDSA